MSTESKLSEDMLDTDTMDDAVLDAVATEASELDVSADLQLLIQQDGDIASFLEGLAEAAAERFSGTQPVLCGIILDRAKRNVVAAASSPEAKQLDEVQAGFDEGPCLEAQRTNTVISVADVRTERRWPGYMAAVREFGMRSVLAMPLTLHSEAQAAMNLYTSTPEAFGPAEIAAARRYADLASQVGLIALRLAARSENVEHLQAAMESRTAIDIAVGVVMAQNRCTQEEAFGILREASSHRNIKLRVLAEELVASVGRQTPATVFDT
ncbi:GAF and ANTAR domain-containing protein [Nesterenkonia lutea]|uniref:ANTAR domain-containing protein n=1 Tax=Nesterenkonia lutea TaxID=272919 RepID=A0ABR9JD50_9MICC|nr:GAF and ANTAR domain-containing protein [Nesterenkonia lutea]MBE1523855.1 hypothetical protein [Nesterenkonia lutea]